MRASRPHIRTGDRHRSRGAVTVEYAFLLVAIAVPLIVGVALGGATLLRHYAAARTQLLAPVP